MSHIYLGSAEKYIKYYYSICYICFRCYKCMAFWQKCRKTVHFKNWPILFLKFFGQISHSWYVI